jgi:spore germination protein GerM
VTRSAAVRRLLLLVAALLPVACGVPDDTRPRSLDSADVPEELLASSTSSTEVRDDGGARQSVVIYLVDREGLLAPVTRLVARADTKTLLEELLRGATDADADRGLRSEIPPNTRLLGIDVLQDDDVITIDLSSQFTSAVGDGELLAQAQVVYTATQGDPAEGVFFLVEGEQREGTNDEGVITSEPLTPDDLADVAPVEP